MNAKGTTAPPPITRCLTHGRCGTNVSAVNTESLRAHNQIISNQASRSEGVAVHPIITWVHPPPNSTRDRAQQHPKPYQHQSARESNTSGNFSASRNRLSRQNPRQGGAKLLRGGETLTKASTAGEEIKTSFPGARPLSFALPKHVLSSLPRAYVALDPPGNSQKYSLGCSPSITHRHDRRVHYHGVQLPKGASIHVAMFGAR